MFINGEWVDSENKKTFETLNPENNEPWAVVPEASAKDVDKAVNAAQKAFENKSHISIDLLALAFPPKHLNADDLCTVFGITTELSLDLRRARIRQLLIRWYVTYLCFCSLLKKLSSNQCTSGILINFSSHLGV